MSVHEGDSTPPTPAQQDDPSPASPGATGSPSAPGYPVYPQPAGYPQSQPPNAPYPPYPAPVPYPQYPPYAPYPGTQPYPGDGYGPGAPVSPATDPWAPEAPPEQRKRFGRVGIVPWTFAQTWRGALLTIVPWVAVIALIQLAQRSLGTNTTTTPTAPVSRLVDIIGAIVALVLTVVVEGAFLIAPLVYALRTRPAGSPPRMGLRALGLRSSSVLEGVGWVVGGFVLMLVVTFVYGWLVQVLHLPLKTNVEVLTNEARNTPLTVVGTLLGAVLIAPICEEIFFRGFLFAGLLRGMNAWVAVLVSAVLFTLVHGDIGSAAPLFIFGIVLAVVRWRTGSIWPGVALHASNNALAAIVTILVIVGAMPPS